MATILLRSKMERIGRLCVRALTRTDGFDTYKGQRMVTLMERMPRKGFPRPPTIGRHNGLPIRMYEASNLLRCVQRYMKEIEDSPCE